MVDAVNRRWVSDSRVDRVPGDEFRPPRVVPSAAWPRELGRAPECRALGHRRVEDLHLADGAGGRLAHALGSTAGEVGVLIRRRQPDSSKKRRSVQNVAAGSKKGSVVPRIRVLRIPSFLGGYSAEQQRCCRSPGLGGGARRARSRAQPSRRLQFAALKTLKGTRSGLGRPEGNM